MKTFFGDHTKIKSSWSSRRERKRHSGLLLLETRSRQGLTSGCAQFIALEFCVMFLTHNGNIYQLVTLSAACLYHDKNTRIAENGRLIRRTTNWLTAHLELRKTKKARCKTLQCRKYARRGANRKTHSAQGVTGRSRDTCECNVYVWTVCAQEDGSMSSLLHCVGSSPFALVHIVGPLTATIL